MDKVSEILAADFKRLVLRSLSDQGLFLLAGMPEGMVFTLSATDGVLGLQERGMISVPKKDPETPQPTPEKPAKGRRKMSAAGRKAIATAQRKRWAAIKKAKK